MCMICLFPAQEEIYSILIRTCVVIMLEALKYIRPMQSFSSPWLLWSFWKNEYLNILNFCLFMNFIFKISRIADMQTIQKLISFKTQLLTIQIAIPYGVTELNLEAVSLVIIKDFWTHNDQNIVQNKMLNESKCYGSRAVFAPDPWFWTHMSRLPHESYVMTTIISQNTSDQSTLWYAINWGVFQCIYHFFQTHHGLTKQNKLFSSPWSFLRP